MYILATHGPFGAIILGVFSTLETLNFAIRVVKINHPEEHKLYYQKIEIDTFDSTLIQFFTMHNEKLIELDISENKENYV